MEKKKILGLSFGRKMSNTEVMVKRKGTLSSSVVLVLHDKYLLI